MNTPLVITTRELTEIRFAMKYNEEFNHGTDGHNRLNLLAKFGRHLGFVAGVDVVPPGVVVDDGPSTGHGKAG